MNCKYLKSNNLKAFLKFVATSLTTTGLDLLIYSLAIDNLERFFPYLYTFIATFLARIFSDSLKYYLDKHGVFNSNEKYGYIKYMFLATSKTLVSASLVTLIAFIGIDYEEIVKMVVDVSLFFPGYFISKIWVHKAHKNNTII